MSLTEKLEATVSFMKEQGVGEVEFGLILGSGLGELEEEIGYTGNLELLYDFYSAIGFCNERIKLYLATNLKKVENPRPQDADETLELFEVTLAEAEELIQRGDICDAKTIMAIQYWKHLQNK